MIRRLISQSRLGRRLTASAMLAARSAIDVAWIEALQMALEEVGEVVRSAHERLGELIRRQGLNVEGYSKPERGLA